MAAATAQSRRLPPPSPRELAWLDGSLLVAALAVTAASMILTPSDGTVWLFGVEIPPLCIFYNLTGIECLGCGLTRSFTYMGNFQWMDAFLAHKLGPFLWGFVAVQVPYRAIRLVRYLLR